MPRKPRALKTMVNEGRSMQTAFQVVIGMYFPLFSCPKLWQTYSANENPPPAAAPPMKKRRAMKKKSSTTIPATGKGAISPTTPRQGQAASDRTHIFHFVALISCYFQCQKSNPVQLHRLWMMYFQTLLCSRYAIPKPCPLYELLLIPLFRTTRNSEFYWAWIVWHPQSGIYCTK